MSEENVEIASAAFKAWSSGGGEAVRPFLADDFELHDAPEFPDASVHRGIPAAMKRWREWQDFMGELPVEVRELIPVGSEVVVVIAVGVAGPSSGITFDQEAAHAMRIEDGKLVRQRAFFTRAEALEAAGLSD